MEDYKEEMRVLFCRHYSPDGKEHQELKRTTGAIWRELRGVLPQHPIDEHDVYEMLKAEGFSQDREILYEQVCINEGDPKKGIQPEYDKVEVGRRFVWRMYEKE